MKQAFYTSADAIGDLICATPTIRKLSQIYKSPITVISHHPYIFKNLPYVDESLHFNDFTENELKENYNLHKSFFLLGKRDSQGVEFKHAMCDIRQFHAKDLGFMLTPDELTCDYIPEHEDISEFNLPDKYIVIHPSKSWGSRTWDKNNWQLLCNSLFDEGIFVVVIGKDTIEKSSNNSKPLFKLNIKNGIDLSNKTTIDQSWNILNNSECVITMDSGILHLAGTTNTHIIQLGSSIKPEYRAPYRKGTQQYKYSYIVGDCKIHCASDLKYSLRDWDSIQNVTLIETCLENKKVFECNPNFKYVLEKIKKVLFDNIENEQNDVIGKPKKIDVEKRTLVQICSNALGDTIAAMAVIEKWRALENKNITVVCKYSNLFMKSYPLLNIVEKKNIEIEYSTLDGLSYLNKVPYTEKISAIYKFEVPLIDGYCKDFGIDSKDIKLKVDFTIKERPIKGRYVCLSTHSTAQCKFWNYPGAWDELCKMFRKRGITPVCIDYNEQFGIEGNFNKVPKSSVKKLGMSLEDALNYIYHSEMFIGLSSGLSWLAQGIGKETVIISNMSMKDHEYIDDKTLRIYDETVCHGCLQKYKFDAGDWLWCPIYRNDNDRRFICTKSITPEIVMNKIEKFYNI